MTEIRIGCDPEGFLMNGDGDYIPAFGIVPGTKESPYKLDGGAVQVDGLAVEFNIDPVTDEDNFHKNINKVIFQIEEMIHDVDKDMRLLWVPIARFRPVIWEIAPEQSKMLGCDPDFNIDGVVNVNPTDKLEGNPIRTAAGHMHIGWLDDLLDDPMESSHFDTCLSIARGFFYGHPKSYIPSTSEEEERMQYYGHNGSFRPKKYGVELRAPSNLWVRTEESRRQIFRETRGLFNEITGL